MTCRSSPWQTQFHILTYWTTRWKRSRSLTAVHSAVDHVLRVIFWVVLLCKQNTERYHLLQNARIDRRQCHMPCNLDFPQWPDFQREASTWSSGNCFLLTNRLVTELVKLSPSRLIVLPNHPSRSPNRPALSPNRLVTELVSWRIALYPDKSLLIDVCFRDTVVMKLKEIDRTANVAWSPVIQHPIYLAAGTAAQQLDATFRCFLILSILLSISNLSDCYGVCSWLMWKAQLMAVHCLDVNTVGPALLMVDIPLALWTSLCLWTHAHSREMLLSKSRILYSSKMCQECLNSWSRCPRGPC